MTTNTINYKDKTFQTTELPQQIQQTVLFYDSAIDAQRAAETKLVIASAASKQLLNSISIQIEQWQTEVEATATPVEPPVEPPTLTEQVDTTVQEAVSVTEPDATGGAAILP